MKILRTKLYGHNRLQQHINHISDHMNMVNEHLRTVEQNNNLLNQQLCIGQHTGMFSDNRLSAAIKQYKLSKEDIYKPTQENLDFWKSTKAALQDYNHINKFGDKYYVGPKNDRFNRIGDGTKKDALDAQKRTKKEISKLDRLINHNGLESRRLALKDAISEFKHYKKD